MYPLAGLPRRRGRIPASIFRIRRLYRFILPFTTYLSLNPNCSAISRFVFPAVFISSISFSTACTCVYCLDIQIAPWRSYFPTSGGFRQCPFFLVLYTFYWGVTFFTAIGKAERRFPFWRIPLHPVPPLLTDGCPSEFPKHRQPSHRRKPGQARCV